jgi:hypothetical protein
VAKAAATRSYVSASHHLKSEAARRHLKPALAFAMAAAIWRLAATWLKQ